MALEVNEDDMTEMLKQSPAQRQQRVVEVPDDNQVIGEKVPLTDYNSDDDDFNDKDANINAGSDPDPDAGGGTGCMNKSWKICSLFGIEIHIHVLLPLFFIISFYPWIRLALANPANTSWYMILCVSWNFALWECILIHELGHCLAGYVVGGHTDKVLLWPLGGLAFTKPPAQLNHDEGDAKKRANNIIIAFGGPLTHIPHMAIYGGLLMWYCQDYTEYYHMYCPYSSNPFATWIFWQETIIELPNGEGVWFWYDFLMIGFMLNFWLFVINLFIPAYPLDGSRIFINTLLLKCNQRKSAIIYCCITGIIAVIAIVLGGLVFTHQTMLLFIGIWAAFQVRQLSMLICSSSESQHPLFNQPI